jgi:diphthine methyl ester acylhydrolase
MIETLHRIDTEYSADSVEFCPSADHQGVVAVGTYQVIEGQENETEGTQRKGRLLLYNISEENEIKEVQRMETGAILDMKWCCQRWNGDVLATVTSIGELHLYTLEDGILNLKDTLLNGKEGILNLSVDWANRANKE